MVLGNQLNGNKESLPSKKGLIPPQTEDIKVDI